VLDARRDHLLGEAQVRAARVDANPSRDHVDDPALDPLDPLDVVVQELDLRHRHAR
jgi:hypothetical protein